MPIGDNLLDEVSRNTEILINNEELAKIPKNILQNEYSKLEKELNYFFNIKGLNIEANVIEISENNSILVSLDTKNLLDEQKELVYNSIGTVFADKFDIEFTVKKDIGNKFSIADYFEFLFVSTDITKASTVLRQKQINNISVSENLINFKLSNTNDNLTLATEIDAILKKENLYARKQGYETKGFKTTNCTRMARCKMFRAGASTYIQSRYEPRGGSNDRNQTIKDRTTLDNARKTTFYEQKLDICLKDYNRLLTRAYSQNDYQSISELTNELVKIYNIPKTKEYVFKKEINDIFTKNI